MNKVKEFDCDGCKHFETDSIDTDSGYWVILKCKKFDKILAEDDSYEAPWAKVKMIEDNCYESDSPKALH